MLSFNPPKASGVGRIATFDLCPRLDITTTACEIVFKSNGQGGRLLGWGRLIGMLQQPYTYRHFLDIK